MRGLAALPGRPGGVALPARVAVGRGDLDERNVQQSLEEFGAAFGSALRTRWRLPLALRELIAAIYQLGGGVYSREILAMNLAGQLSRLPAGQGLEKVASGKTARLLKLGLPELRRLRKEENPEVKPQEEPPVAGAEVSS